MKPTVEISEAIERELLSWPDVTVGQHRFGGREFRIGKREIGHLHGSSVADLPFPRAMRDELVSRGKVSPHHHIAVAAGLVSVWLASLVRVEEAAAPAFNSSKLQASANTISLNSQF